MATFTKVDGAPPAMTERQRDVFDNVLAIGADRPFAPVGLVDAISTEIAEQLAPVVARWTESSLWVTKSTLTAVRRCEVGFVHSRTTPREGRSPVPAMVGDVTHRALQLLYTHPGSPIATYVQEALLGCRNMDPAFDQSWSELGMSAQSDALMSAVSRVTGFADSWPALQTSWEPRFEEPLQAKVGKVTLAARADLVLGRPRTSGQQSMVVCDWKSGGLGDGHPFEGRYHALVATLSHGVPPFRSLVYSLASGQYTDPDVTAASLRAGVAETVAAVGAMVDLLTERRPPQVRCEQRWCAGCQAASSGSGPVQVFASAS